jgi:hypothetical protein
MEDEEFTEAVLAATSFAELATLAQEQSVWANPWKQAEVQAMALRMAGMLLGAAWQADIETVISACDTLDMMGKEE